MEINNIEQLRALVIRGLDLTIKKLIEKKSREDKDLIFWQDGKIVRVKAKNLR